MLCPKGGTGLEASDYVTTAFCGQSPLETLGLSELALQRLMAAMGMPSRICRGSAMALFFLPLDHDGRSTSSDWRVPCCYSKGHS